MKLRVLAPLVAGLLLASGVAAARVSANTSASRPNASTVVATYSSIFNAGMKSGDFSAVASVFAPDATFTRSTPAGKTTVYHGIKAIISGLGGVYKAFPGYQWTIDQERSLDQWVVLAYEHAGSPPLSVAGRCEHVFVVVDGKIRSYDWTTFFPGVK